MVSALVAATESPQLPPEARERILAFLKLHRTMIAALDTTRPDLFVHRLIERLGLRRQQLFAANADVVERLQSLARLGELAAAFVRRAPQATPREFGRSIAAVAEAGLREEDADADARPRSVAVLSMHAAKGLEFDHVYVLGLHSARMPGARNASWQPLPDALLGERAHPETESREAHQADMRRLLHVAMTRARRGLVLSYAGHGDRGALQPPSPFVEDARAALGAEWEEHDERLFGPDETLYATFRELRDEMLEELPRVGTRLGELRFDTDLDVAHSVVRYLELVKLAALLERPAGQSVADALPGVNARLLGAVSAQQREVLESSPLDDALLEAERDERARAAAIASRAEPSLEPFLPKRGDGVMLSASDIETYRTCPLKYKFARVFRIPQEPTLNQRFGILVHQVSSASTPASRSRSRRCSRCSRPAGAVAASATATRSSSSRQGAHGADALPRALPRRARRAGVVRALVRVPPRPAHAARSGRPGRPPPRRLGRAHRLQDGPAPHPGAAARRRPAQRLRDGRARGVGLRGVAAVLLLRARRREGPAAAGRGRPGVGRGDGVHRRRGDPRSGLRAHALLVGLLVLRLPDRLPGRRALSARPAPPARASCGTRGAGSGTRPRCGRGSRPTARGT
jgi:hypothetical protein